ncbi:MAG: ATP-binding protein [Solirubrobacteraceae bacterium]
MIDSAAMLAEQIVTACPLVAVVSTSREPLRIAGEHVYRVPSLSLPATDDGDPECLPDSEAVRLFVDRARQQRRGFALDSQNCGSVARLCHRLDGIPLAIELAAARLRSIAPDEIEKRLDQRFALLTGGTRTALPRQQTLQALIDWSYTLLSPSEQEVLQRLSVFAGGFDLESAEMVAGYGQDGSVLDVVVALVDKSLVEWDDTNDRYRLLESIRDYAAAKLLARGDAAAEAVYAAHRDYYLGLAETAVPHLIGHGQAEWLDRLQLELDNLRAAISECVADPDPEPALRLAHGLRFFWAYREPSAEGAHAVCAALDRPDAQAPTLLRGRALIAAAHLLTAIAGEYDAARARAHEALAIARGFSDERLLAEALNELLFASIIEGDEETHARLADEAVRAARALGDPNLTARILFGATGSTCVSHNVRARALKESLVLARDTGDQILHVRALGALGYAAMQAGEMSTARRYLEHATRLVRNTGDQSGLTTCALNLGLASYLDGADAVARALFDEALRIAQRNGDLYMLAHAQLGLALLATRAGNAYAAATLHGVADAIHERLGTSVDSVESRLRAPDINALRETLGNEAFEHAYDAGRRVDPSVEHTLPNPAAASRHHGH